MKKSQLCITFIQQQMMKVRILHLLLLLSSLLGYLEWGGNHHIFLFQGEAEIISKLFSHPLSVLHPLVILPLAAQIMLLINMIKRKPNKVIAFTAIAGLGILFGLMFIIGLMSLNFKIIISTIPFLIVVFLIVRQYRKHKKNIVRGIKTV